MILKTLWKNNHDKIFKSLSLLIIVAIILFDVLPSWYYVVQSFFSGSIFDTKNLAYLSEHIVSVHSNFLTIGFLLTVWLILKKRLTLISFTLILLSSWTIGIYEFMDNVLHPLFMNMGIFSKFMRPGIPDLNPQYTRLTLFLLSTFILFILSFNKKTRTIDRSFVLLISGSMLITTFIFHLAIPMGMLKYAKQERLNTFVTNMAELPESYFCKNKTCMFFNDKFEENKEKFFGDRDLASKFNSFTQYSKEFFSNKENLIYPVYGNAGDFIGEYSTFHACLYKNEKFMCAFDSNSMKNYGILAKVLFSFLTSIAHGVWIFGGLFLLSMHKNRSIRKLAHRAPANN